ncbi:MAG: hypothetical protein KA004_13415 [Verrucomicrobiales bacterium]|nr:hypothetical protein [Verrucomicrobiales bacterium]
MNAITSSLSGDGAGFPGIIAVSSSVTDIVLRPSQVSIVHPRVDFTLPSGVRWLMPYDGPPLASEGKRTVQHDLSHFRNTPGAQLRPGSGGVNSVLFARGLEPQATFVLVDSSAPGREVASAMKSAGVVWHPLGTGPVAANLILEWKPSPPASPARICLRGPRTAESAAPVLQNSVRPRIFDWPREKPMTLWLNSCRDSALVRMLSDEAAARGLPQYSVLTPALPLRERLSLQLERDVLSMANWEETQELARGLGLPTPDEPEDQVDLADAAETVRRIMAEGGRGDVITTFGPRGLMASGRSHAAVWWIHLHDQKLIERLVACSGKVTGMGDRCFAATALAHFQAPPGPGRVVRAAHLGAAQVVGHACGLAVAPRDAFLVRPVAATGLSACTSMATGRFSAFSSLLRTAGRAAL